MGPTSISLNGTLNQQNTTHALDVLGQVFSAYISDETVPIKAKGVYATQANGDNISWLSAGVEALTIDVPLKAPNPIDPIKSIEIGYMNLSFTEETEWAPVVNTNEVTAELGALSLDFCFLRSRLRGCWAAFVVVLGAFRSS